VAFFLGKDREARRAYGFDEVAIVPGRTTVDPLDVDISVKIGDIGLDIPFLASAMDGVVDVGFAVKFAGLGGIAVLNLDGIHTRYKDTKKVYERIINAPVDKVNEIIQDIYKEPMKPKLIGERIGELKKAKVAACVSTIPQNADSIAKLVQEAGADILIIQGTVLSTKHISSKHKPVDLKKLCKGLKIPVILGNCVGYKTALDLMDTGCVDPPDNRYC
jgi:IMP dehydrogenase